MLHPKSCSFHYQKLLASGTEFSHFFNASLVLGSKACNLFRDYRYLSGVAGWQKHSNLPQKKIVIIHSIMKQQKRFHWKKRKWSVKFWLTVGKMSYDRESHSQLWDKMGNWALIKTCYLKFSVLTEIGFDLGQIKRLFPLKAEKLGLLRK